jgi:hypothetical protein
MPKLAMMLILATALAGCITPQKLYKINKGSLADASCDRQEAQACLTGQSAGAAYAKLAIVGR